MKLSDSKPYFETSGEMQEHFFSIEDQGMIFDILRSKMYSNPILAICREISCNARDAHREVGKADQPVEIHLPNSLEPEFKIKDFGPGISPERMTNIFIKYTASTKRGDNLQTGGFGLGAKTPFSYSDQFTVTTVHNGIKYSYVCSIDDTRVGKLMLLNQRSTDEVNSTEISIPVKRPDFNFFRQYVEQSCRHWDVKPNITGGNVDWQPLKKILEGEGWAIAANNDYQHYAKLVIDGIEYPLELDALRKYADPKLIDSARGNFIMYFGVGELSLSANREQIFLDKPTQEKIKLRLEAIIKEIKKSTDDKINALPDLWAANLFYRKELSGAFNNLAFLGKLVWKTYELDGRYLDFDCSIYTFTRGKYSRKLGNDPNKLSRSMARSLQFQENAELYVNDLPIKEPTPRHVKKAFEDNPALNTMIVVCPNDKVTEAVLNKEFGLDEMKPKRLSAITKASARSYTAPSFRLLVFKFDPNAGAFRQLSYDSMDEDTNQKVLCLLTRDDYNTRNAILKTKTYLRSHELKTILDKDPKISIYGVDASVDAKRLDEEFNDFTKLDDYIDQKVLNNKSINYVEIKFAQEHVYDVDERMLRISDKLIPLINDPKSSFVERLTLHKKIKTLSNSDRGLLDIYESVNGNIKDTAIQQFLKDNPDWDIQKLNRKYAKTYPLLGAINSYNTDSLLEHFAHYVNAIDKI